MHAFPLARDKGHRTIQKLVRWRLLVHEEGDALPRAYDLAGGKVPEKGRYVNNGGLIADRLIPELPQDRTTDRHVIDILLIENDKAVRRLRVFQFVVGLGRGRDEFDLIGRGAV